MQKQLVSSVKRLRNNTGLILNLALNYGSRKELTDAIKTIVNLKYPVSKIDENLISKYLYTSNLPDPDLLIRTSGEHRVSNFLLWQIAYTELYVTDTFWPDFYKHHLYEAVINYQSRERRFGGVR